MRGVGTDTQDYAAVAEALRAHGSRYLDRVYTPEEQRAAGCPADDAAVVRALTATYAAKEAALKALGGPALPWTEIRVTLPGSGRTGRIDLGGAAARHAEWIGVSALMVSVSTSRTAAVAIVLTR